MAGPKKNESDGEGSMSSSDPYGIGMLADGKLNIVPKGDLMRRIAERDADEAADADEDGEPDVSDLDDED